MKVVIQRVFEASVFINEACHSSIQQGLLILVGIENTDSAEDVNWLTSKIVQLRIFNDSNKLMNHSIVDVNGEVLVVSQFTLHASTKKGNRPSYMLAARPEIAKSIYESFIHAISTALKKRIATGVFGADMKVKLVNDGPVTIIIDSKNRV